MEYDLIVGSLAAVFPLAGCALFVIFWRLLRDDSKLDPVYRSKDLS